MSEPIRVAAIVGNPRTPSRTGHVAERLLETFSSLGANPFPLIDLAHLDLGLALLKGEVNEAVQQAFDAVQQSQVIAVVSPTYKAAMTGLTKVFLDLLPHNGLAGKVALPIMVGGSLAHQLAVETTMRPVLTELGALGPARGLFLLEAGFDPQTKQVGPEQAVQLEALCREGLRLAR